ncbi:hypothetical protein LTR53_015734 [Teratosphaeriaceae sp. CCFEE 6253]|nr:hypothetical protein LTR53_015734 [Teratosphaeriaceae sp. CCFEE 6253]
MADLLFNKLSAELRNEIYETALPRDQEFTIKLVHGRLQQSGPHKQNTPLALAAVYKKAWLESTQIFYHNNAFVIQDHGEAGMGPTALMTFRHRIGRKNAAAIMRITVDAGQPLDLNGRGTTDAASIYRNFDDLTTRAHCSPECSFTMRVAVYGLPGLVYRFDDPEKSLRALNKLRADQNALPVAASNYRRFLASPSFKVLAILKLMAEARGPYLWTKADIRDKFLRSSIAIGERMRAR